MSAPQKTPAGAQAQWTIELHCASQASRQSAKTTQYSQGMHGSLEADHAICAGLLTTEAAFSASASCTGRLWLHVRAEAHQRS